MWFDMIIWVILSGAVLVIYYHSRSIDNMIDTLRNQNSTIELLIKEQQRVRDVVAHHLGEKALGELYDGVELSQNKEP